MSSSQIHLGIIAGAGQFPFMVLEGAQRAGCRVTVVGLSGLADPALAGMADRFYWAGIAKMGRWIRLLRRTASDQVILAGAVTKTCMYGRFRLLKMLPDWTSARIWFFQIPDKRNDTVLTAVADEFAKYGIIMQECTQYTKEHFAGEGVLSKAQPSESQRKDAKFGWDIAKQMGLLDIGQSVAVKETEVIAVEAIEGTDRMIERAGQLCSRGGWAMIKVAKPNQDMRFDVPTIGPDTISNLQRHGATMLVIEAGKTVIIDKEATLSAADKTGMVVVGC